MAYPFIITVSPFCKNLLSSPFSNEIVFFPAHDSSNIDPNSDSSGPDIVPEALEEKVVQEVVPEVAEITPIFEEERVGDVRHSLADISLANEYLDYDPIIDSRRGLSLTVQSHITSQ